MQRNHLITKGLFVLVVLTLLISGTDLFAGDQESQVLLPEVAPEQLLFMELEITSSARRPQPLTHATNAVYVITAEDIRQAGPVRIEDLFRLVP